MHDKAPAPQQSTHDAPTQQGNTRVMVTNLHYELTPKDLIVRANTFLPISLSNPHLSF
jgi:hypothetical protein